MTLLIIEDQEGVFAMLRDLLAAALPRVRTMDDVTNDYLEMYAA